MAGIFTTNSTTPTLPSTFLIYLIATISVYLRVGKVTGGRPSLALGELRLSVYVLTMAYIRLDRATG